MLSAHNPEGSNFDFEQSTGPPSEVFFGDSNAEFHMTELQISIYRRSGQTACLRGSFFEYKVLQQGGMSGPERFEL